MERFAKVDELLKEYESLLTTHQQLQETVNQIASRLNFRLILTPSPEQLFLTPLVLH